MEIIYHETGSTSAPYNLAMEEALADVVGQGGPGRFMLWQNSPAVIIGRHQNVFSEVRIEELRRRGYHLVRRLTGGGAVYHDLGNLNFSFILPLVGREAPQPARLLSPLINYLKSLGVTAVMEGRNDLSLPGRGKFSGLAGRRLPGGWQLHGTIMYDVALDVLEKVLLVDPDKYQSKGVASVRARVTNLKPHLSMGLPELWAGLKEAYGFPFAPIAEEIQAAARKLAETKYGLDSWNIGQSPPGDITLKNRFPFGSLELRLATKNNKIVKARITGDFLTPSHIAERLPIEKLEEALLGLPADRPERWSEAWAGFDLADVFQGPVDQAAIQRWLRGA
ncbi:lipoate--protein ligase [Deltaproteobacteria bacterium]|nr:lipoate--protein ligase [Deltaproteobacteria bacterium]